MSNVGGDPMSGIGGAATPAPIGLPQMRARVLETVASVAPGFDPGSIRSDRPLRRQIELDSLDWVNVLALLEERLQIEIPQADASRFTTLDGMAAYLASRLASPPTQAPPACPDPLAALPRTFELLDGTCVTLRPMGAGDAQLDADFVRRLSPRSRYMRFMASIRELPQDKLKAMTDVDLVRHVALAATIRRADEELLLGVARYVVDAAGTGCEFAIAVDDAAQGTGLAGVLMQTLIAIARSRQLERMQGIVLAANDRMVKFLHQLGFTLHRDPEDPGNRIAARAL